MNTRTLSETGQVYKEKENVSGCQSDIQVKSTDIDQIKLELIVLSRMPNGIAYTLKLKNLSKFTIAQILY